MRDEVPDLHVGETLISKAEAEKPCPLLQAMNAQFISLYGGDTDGAQTDN